MGQILNVKGRLKAATGFWVEVLQTPSPVIGSKRGTNYLLSKSNTAVCTDCVIYACLLYYRGILTRYVAIVGRDPADKLPETVLKSRADSTTKKYLGAFRRWKQWALKHGAKSFPVDGKYLALYLQYIGETIGSKSAVEEAVHAIAWIHSAAGVNSPTSSPFITIILEGLRRSLARPVTKNTPFNIEMLAAMVDDTRKNETLSNVRLSTVCLLAFAGFLRFDEISKLCLIDLTIDEDKLIIKIRSSKTDQ